MRKRSKKGGGGGGNRKEAKAAAQSSHAERLKERPDKVVSRGDKSIKPATVAIDPEGAVESISLWLFLLALYAYTVYPSISGGDTGELVVTACNWGVAHPPGYPTYTIVNALFSRLFGLFLPSTTIAYRAGLLSCIWGSLACMFLYKSTVRMTGDKLSGLFAAIGFGLSPTVWLYSIQGEVFALNNLFVSLIIYLSVLFFEASSNHRYGSSRKGTNQKVLFPDLLELVGLHSLTSSINDDDDDDDDDGEADQDKQQNDGATTEGGNTQRTGCDSMNKQPTVQTIACWGAFVCGLALTNQHTTVFPVGCTALAVVATLYWLGLLAHSYLIIFMGLFGLLGLSPYIYLPLSASTMALDTWGDQRDLDGFLTHFLRKEYGTFQLAASEIGGGPDMGERLLKYLQVTGEECFHIPIVLAVLGVIGSFFVQKRRHVWRHYAALCLLAGYLSYVLVFHYLSNLNFEPLFLGVQKRFWMQANIYMWLFAGAGFSASMSYVTNLSFGKSPAAGRWRWIFSLLFVSILGQSMFMAHFPKVNHRHNRVVESYGKKMLESMPKNAIMLVNGDLNNNAVKYLQQCENMRTDVAILGLQQMSWSWWVPMHRHHYPNITFPGNRYHVSFPGSFNMFQFLKANMRKKPIFLCGPWKAGDDSTEVHYQLHPYGLCHKISRKGKQPKKLFGYLLKGWKALPKMSDFGPWKPRLYGDDTWEHVAFHDTWHRMVYHSGVVSFHASQGPPAKDEKLLSLAKNIYDHIFSRDLRKLLSAKKVYRTTDYRGAGIIYAKWAATKKKGYARAKAEKAMLTLWKIYLKLAPEDQELKPFVDASRNPFTGEVVESFGDDD